MIDPNARLKPRLFRLGISQSIIIGFAMLLLISLAVTGFHFSGLRQFNQHFSTFQIASTATNRMLKIDKDVSELQRQILAFSYTEKITSTAQLKTLHQHLIDDINLLINSEDSSNPERSHQLLQMKLAVEGLTEKIDSLQTQRHFRETIIHTNLEAHYNETAKIIDDIFILENNNFLMLNDLWQAEHHLNQARYISSRYFSKHEFQLKKEVSTHLNETEKTFKFLISKNYNGSTKKNINDILNNLTKIKTVFNQAVQADRNYLFLINVVLAGETAEINNIAENLRTTYLSQQQELVDSTDQHIRFIKNISIFSSIIGALLAIAIALVISNRIRKPLYSITDTFSRLAQGENLQEIPGTARVDEIGKLAQAANVFRQTNVRTQELLTQAEEFTKQLKQREVDLELAVKKAESANLSKSQFLANMSHELRTPMNAILGMLSLLQKTELNARQTDYTIKTEGAAKSLLSLLNDILDLSKAEAGKMELDPIGFNLDNVLRDLSVILSTNIANKPVELLFDLSDEVPRYLLGDSLRLQQILINLGSNAIKFTHQGSVVIAVTQNSISTDSVNLTFSVKDSGIGIAPENQQKIFSGFTQAEASTTRRFGGTGLGLAISQKLVSLMGGQLSLKSEPGIGSLFFFSIELPLLSTDAMDQLKLNQQQQHKDHNNKRLPSMKILLVEDNLTNQQIALELLEAEGAIVSIANHGQEAIDFLQSHLQSHQTPGVDLVLMDLQMPIMDGLTATEKIRTELKLDRLPIVAMTANAMKSDRDACLNAGMNEHLGKPFDLQHVIKVLRAQVGWTTIESPQQKDEAPHQDSAPTHPSIQTETKTASQRYNEIDLTSAVARMGGNQNLYLKMLPKFLDNLRKLPTQLNTHLSTGDITTLTRELHSLKGLSATMGATQLSEEIARMEKTLKHNPQHPDVAEMVKTACELIGNNIESVSVLVAELEAPE